MIIKPIKLLLCAAFMYAFLPVSAQIPNGGFENWKSENHEELLNWNVFGPVNSVSNGSGGTAIRLSNNSTTGDFGIIGMVNYDTGAFYAPYYAYSGQNAPDSVIFRVRLQLLSDTTFINLGFTKTGEDFPVATADIKLSGNSGTWQTLVFPVQYINLTPSLKPDSAYFVLTSANESGGPAGNGSVDIDFIEFKYSSNAMAQAMPNNSFENWNSSSVEYPDEWAGSQQLIWYQNHAGAISMKTTDKHSGSFALEVKPTITSEAGTGKKDTIPGYCFTQRAGSSADMADVFTPAFSVNQRYTSFRGWMKTTLGSGDIAVVWINLFNQGNIVAAGYLNDGTTHDFAEFSVDLVWDTAFSGIPDSASVGLFVSDSMLEGALHPAVSRAVFDDLRFDNWNTGVTGKVVLSTNLHPNPSTGNAVLTMNTNSTSDITVKLMDMNGRTLYSKEFPGSHFSSVPVFTNPAEPGIYFLEIRQGNALQTHKIILTP